MRKNARMKECRSGKAPVAARSRRTLAVSLSPFLAFSLCCLGCDAQTDSMRRLKDQVEAQKTQIATLEKNLADAQKTVDEQKQQIATLQKVGPDRMAKLVVPTGIQFARLTGGYDDDGRPGDDGVVAYVQPVDVKGHVIKVAGSIRMQVFDLANPPGRQVVAEGEWDVDHVADMWNGRLWTGHYTVKCPWPPPDRKPPDHRELTIRVEFTDLLTGKTFTAQKVVEVKFHADVRPVVRPDGG